MKLNELVAKYKELSPAKRRLVMIMAPAAVFLFALVTAPHSPSLARDTGTLSASVISDCDVTKMRMSVFGRSLMAYDWQSGNCLAVAGKSRKAIE